MTALVLYLSSVASATGDAEYHTPPSIQSHQVQETHLSTRDTPKYTQRPKLQNLALTVLSDRQLRFLDGESSREADL